MFAHWLSTAAAGETLLWTLLCLGMQWGQLRVPGEHGTDNAVVW